MANICFGCNDVGDIEKCQKKDCTYYPDRDHHIEMDTEANEARTRMVRRGFKELVMYKTKAVVVG